MDPPPEFPPIPHLDEGLDWSYSMRREMQEIIPGLYLGPYSSAMRSKCEYLLTNNITHIICIRQAVEAHFIRPNFPETFKYMVLDIADAATENIIQHFAKVKKFLDDCWLSGGKALIHGNAGISRSAAVVIAFIMEKYGLTYKRAFLLVQRKRFCINPNEGFAQQLKEYEPIYQAKRVLQNGQTSQQTGKLKRHFEDVDNDDYSSPPDIERMDCSGYAENGSLT